MPPNPPGITAGLRIQLEEGIDILENVPSITSLGVVLGNLILIKFVDLVFEVAMIYRDPHFIYHPDGGQRPLRHRLVNAPILGFYSAHEFHRKNSSPPLHLYSSTG